MGNSNSNGKLTMKDIEEKYKDTEMDEILTDYAKYLEKFAQMKMTKTEEIEESTKIIHELHLFIKMMYNIMKELKPEDEEDKQNAIEYLETFGNLVTFLDGYSSDFTKLIIRRREMIKLEGLAEQVGKSIDKMAKGVEDVGKAMDCLGDTLGECEDEIVIPLFVNDMVKKAQSEGMGLRREERMLLTLDEILNHFRALEINRKPVDKQTENDKIYLEIFLHKHTEFKEENKENVKSLYREYYKNIKALQDLEKKCEEIPDKAKYDSVKKELEYFRGSLVSRFSQLVK